MTQRPFVVFGVEITREHHPNLYRIAERNPEGLAEQLQGWAKMAVTSDLTSIAATLEHDLEHERRGGSKG